MTTAEGMAKAQTEWRAWHEAQPWSREFRVRAGLTRDWRSFDQVAKPYGALDAKQLTGALVRLRNRGEVESRRIHESDCYTEWRLTR